MQDCVAAEVAKLIEADADPKVEMRAPEGCEVHFLGKPIFVLNPATNNLTLPTRFLNHPLVVNRYCFSLPRELWDEVHNRVGPNFFDSELVALEDTMSEICGDHSLRTGFWCGRASSYNLLRRPPSLHLSAGDTQSVGMEANQAQLDHAMRIYEERSESLAKVSRAYAGWLMVNQQFLNEHDALFAQWEDTVRRWGLDRLGILLPQGMFLAGDDPNADPRWPAFRAAFEEFFTRWRLQGLAAPYLPIPLQPLMGGQFPISVLPQVMRAGGVFVLPDTFPIPSRDSLRGMLEDALHGGSPPEHLTEWMGIIASDNMARKSLTTFARLFEVQHYYRILHHRHASGLRRKVTVVKQVLASFLGTQPRTIHDDLRQLSRRLGSNWIHRGSASPLGPFSSMRGDSP